MAGLDALGCAVTTSPPAHPGRAGVVAPWDVGLCLLLPPQEFGTPGFFFGVETRC